MALLLPSDFASQALYSTYYLAQPDDYDPVKSNMTAFETAESDAMKALVPRADATKLFAVVSGNWNTAGNWYPSGVPGANADVVIGDGCTCTYNKDDDTTVINTIRVDGTFKGDISMSTALVVDTFVVMPTGSFIDGTRAEPVPQGITHEWIIATSNGAIDVTWDTFMQSRGYLSMGFVSQWGHRKTSYLKAASRTAPDTGATSLSLVSAPTDWEVGDEIVICATRYGGPNSALGGGATEELPLQNEKRTIATISGADITWTGGLTYSHVAPPSVGNGTTYAADWMGARCYVANLTRNIVFRPDDANADIHHRGHTMQMHNYNGWSARNVEWRNLGRTAKIAGYFSRIIFSTAGCAADTPMPLSGSPYWNGSAIEFGPTFIVNGEFTATGDGSYEIVGTDEDGAPQTETVNYTTGYNGFSYGVKYFKTITSITFTTAFASLLPRLYINARSRQRNENGVRNMNTSTTAGDWTYTTQKNTVNLQGRYPFHWHKMGVIGDILESPPVLDGCSFHNSPSWGVAQHQTHGHIKNCVGYDCQGAAFVAEDGNETGVWIDNIGIGSEGNTDHTNKLAYDLLNRDPARSGAAFAYTSRSIRVIRCIGVGSAAGHVFNVRPNNITLLREQLEQPTSARGEATLDPRVAPLAHNIDNEGIACFQGIEVIKASPQQHNDIRIPIVRFKAWSVGTGVNPTYTAHYSMIDCKALRGYLDGNITDNSTFGMGFTDVNSSDQVFINPVIEGFIDGIHLLHNHSENTGGPAFNTDPLNGRYIVNPTFIGLTGDEYVDFNGDIDFILATGDLSAVTPSISVTETLGVVSGTKTDELGAVAFPFGFDDFTNNRDILSAAYGYYTDVTDGKKYVLSDEWFGSRLTGQLYKIKVPIDLTGVTTTGDTNHGSTDLANNTAPVLADFTVSMTLNTPLIIDVVGRATGNTVSFGGMQHPPTTHLIDNGDGTITAVPLADESYTESFKVWVDDKNGNTTSATVTLNFAASTSSGSYAPTKTRKKDIKANEDRKQRLKKNQDEIEDTIRLAYQRLTGKVTEPPILKQETSPEGLAVHAEKLAKQLVEKSKESAKQRTRNKAIIADLQRQANAIMQEEEEAIVSLLLH